MLLSLPGLEAKVIEMQDDCDQMEGLNTQEMAKIKHMVSIDYFWNVKRTKRHL